MNTRSPPANEKRRCRGRDTGARETIKLIIPTFPYRQWEQDCRGHGFVDGRFLHNRIFEGGLFENALGKPSGRNSHFGVFVFKMVAQAMIILQAQYVLGGGHPETI